MKIRNIVGGSVVLLSLAAYSSIAPASAATTLSSPDSDALTAAYQLIQFDQEECSAISHGAAMTNGTRTVSPDILQVSAKICSDAQNYRPKLEQLAKDHDFKLPDWLPYSLTARYAALIRDAGPGLGVRYLNDQISSHEDALAVFQDEAANGKDPELKAAAAEIIPVVQSNLDLLKATLVKHD
jgi:putative membrane protein